MTLYFSQKNKGFYDGDMKLTYCEAGSWPDDAVEVSKDAYNSIMNGQSSGKIIDADDFGYPILIEPVIDWNNLAELERADRVKVANNHVADWRTELELGIISADDRELLILWMQYIKLLKELDLSGVGNEMMFKSLQWPTPPL